MIPDKDSYHKVELKDFRELAKNHEISIVVSDKNKQSEGNDVFIGVDPKALRLDTKCQQFSIGKNRQPKPGKMFYIHPFNPNYFR